MQHDGIDQAVLYAAKSSPDERGSIPRQLRAGVAWAKENGLRVDGEYDEENVSAYKGDRGPELAAALEHAERTGATLVVQHSDRLARGDGKQARHLVEIALWALKTGVRVHCIQDPRTFENIAAAAAMGERNMEDSKRKVTGIKEGLAERRREGKPTGGIAAYGLVYRRNAADERELVIEEAEAPFVRRMFDELVAGIPQRQITLKLEAEGVPTRSGGRWRQPTVRKMLKNPVYAGLIRDGDNLVEGRHEAIVDRETWEKAQALMAATARTHKRGRPCTSRHLFRKGFLRCGICGGSLGPTTKRHSKGLCEEYRCIERKNDSSACSMRQISRAAVDTAVYAYFEGAGLDLEDTRDQLVSVAERKLAEARELLKEAEREEEESKARLKRVKHDYINGDLTAEEWRELRAELELKAQRAKAATRQHRENVVNAEADRSRLEGESELLEVLAEIRGAVAQEIVDAQGVAAVRAALMRLFDGFVLRRGASGQERLEPTGSKVWLEPVLSEHAVARGKERQRPHSKFSPPTQTENYSLALATETTNEAAPSTMAISPL
jgi:DNA invertase Pin-like site-specific DNA recombinase